MTQNSNDKGPLTGLNVIDFGHYYAGPMVAMLLADQGANVIRIVRPGEPELPSQQYRLFNRNKKLLPLDLKTAEGKAQALSLIEKADVVIENFRPDVMQRLGLDYASVKETNPGLVYLSLPGFASTDKERAHIQAWEGVLGAAACAFTQASKVREPLGFPPNYTWVPQCSMYGGFNGALAVMAALVAREACGSGTVIEVPLADAGLFGFSFELWYRGLAPAADKSCSYSPGDTESVQLEKLDRAHRQIWANPIGRFYPCADGREIFIYTLYPNVSRYGKRLFKALGIDKQLKREGFVNAGTWETSYDNNLDAPDYLNAECKERLTQLLSEVLLTKTAKEWEDILAEAKVAATVIRTREEWLALQPLLRSGLFARMDNGKSTMIVPGRVADMSEPGDVLRYGYEEPEVITAVQAHLLLDSQKLNPQKVNHQNLSRWYDNTLHRDLPLKKGDLLRGLKVLDLSNMLAGPLAALFLAEYGADVIKADSADCPSPAAIGGGILLHGKRSILTDITTAPGRKLFEQLVSWADVVTHNILDDTAKRMGVSHTQLQAINPKLVNCQISAFGGTLRGGWENRPGYDNLLQSASGLMSQFGTLTAPQDHGGVACTDIAGGLNLAFAALLGVYQQRRTGYGGEGRASLARAANYYQLPYMIADANGRSEWGEPGGQFALGKHWWQQLYACSDGWIYVGTSEERAGLLLETVMGDRLDVRGQNLKAAFAQRSCSHWQTVLEAVDIGCHRVLKMDDIHHRYKRVVGHEEADETACASTEILCWENYPYIRSPFLAVAPNYVRVGADHTWKRLPTTPRLGEHTVEILREFGYSESEIKELIELKVFHEFLPALGSKDVFMFEPEKQ